MEFREVLARRRMVRNYTGEPVERGALERIAAAALRAPSAGFSQGQAVVVVTDPAVRQEIAEAAGESSYVQAGFDPWVSRAPAHLVLCVSEAAYHRRYQMPDKVDDDGNEIEWPVPYWWVDVGASLMAVLLAAVDEGLAAGFLGTHALDDLQSLLGIPDEYIPVGVVTVGHPATDRRSSSLDLGRRPIPSEIHWDGWNTHE
ncbi:MAG TPA: nitroreductase family protein [Acidimicrobiia bacterium]|nr:nitroreductase family protein [Acidimicrobiia bacterium]